MIWDGHDEIWKINNETKTGNLRSHKNEIGRILYTFTTLYKYVIYIVSGLVIYIIVRFQKTFDFCTFLGTKFPEHVAS